MLKALKVLPTSAINGKTRGMSCPKAGVTHYYAYIRLPDKDRTIKVLVVCNS